MTHPNSISLNGRDYPWPTAPVVVVCVDGSEPAYIEEAIKAGVMPFTAKMLAGGADLRADCVVPSFTNPNNLSIVTGAPPSVHGICGNFILDPDTGEEVMMNNPKYLTADTIFKAFHDAGATVAVVTAKDKLRNLLGHGLDFASGRAICFSSEIADQATMESNGIDGVVELVGKPVPSVYSADLSEFIFAAGVKLLNTRRPDLMYLSTTDYVQHKHAPGSEGANSFYAMMDGYWAQLVDMGATLAITADHGMSAKHNTGDKQPKVIYLQEVFDDWMGEGAARVILPITDPYVVHHGALGGYATVYLPDGSNVEEICAQVMALPNVETCLSNADACAKFELPNDKVGDLVIVSVKDTALGTAPARHDLTGLKEPLRSHGGISEQTVPLLFSRPVTKSTADLRLRNFDIFYMAMNDLAGTNERIAS
ncbi:MAG: phosphonoacetate hydrolase [Rhodospirillales bacterium]|jgi:phosphonoacetate hydrolase|nr:phosphonoacetate hydrolase [Rhodospirillales bacterium]MBT4038927.1 phosphonoacetate hydrolase [Rhodospirillales bacterium]MBT4625563.1 phosphonoacetate hydrolase [Rhodospirillales bacterium]MBT5352268.1 phosphonoacetate hydrolase [Rhodospirillales bacterium]MBT5521354.1 phosphonoacetate hydrolase [Rhodospirillales bacterium]